MSYQFPQKGNNNAPPFASDSQGYRPSPRHDLFYDNTPNLTTPSAPPHLESPRPISPLENPFTAAEEPRQPFSDYRTTELPNYSSKDDLSNQYFEPQQPQRPFQPLYPNPNDPYGNIEQGFNPPTPPLPPAPKRRTLFSRLFDGDQKYAYFCWIISLIQIAVFIGELVKNTLAMKTPIEIHPVFNPLLGPSSFVLVNMGARFPPCMHAIPGITDNLQPIWPCLNNTQSDGSGPLCTLEDICGLGGFHGKPPDQWFRVIIPIFLHGGVIHIFINLLIQLRLGADMERVIGTIRFILIYFPSGIMGFILGANFAGDGIASTGCSGSLFGIIAVVLLDLLYNWRIFKNPKRQLATILIQVIICFGLGLLPGLDNFSHIGGFTTGLLLGIAVMRTPQRIRARITDQRSNNSYDLDTPYTSLTGRGASTGRRRGLVGYFQGRKGWWWIWLVIRVACLVLVVVTMALLLINFYAHGGGHCSWCRYLSCLPVNGWCDLGNIQTNSTSTSPSRMMLF